MRTKKQHITKTLRALVWEHYIGGEFGRGVCYCCHRIISVADFECGHVVAESRGGATTVANLRPICGLCNRSMGATNMNAFMLRHGLRAAWCPRIRSFARLFIIVCIHIAATFAVLKYNKYRTQQQTSFIYYIISTTSASASMMQNNKELRIQIFYLFGVAFAVAIIINVFIYARFVQHQYFAWHYLSLVVILLLNVIIDYY